MNHESPIPEDQHILPDIISGSEPALSLLIKKYWKDIYFLALTYLRQPEQAEEAVQDVFVKIWTTRSRLAEVGNFRNYLFIITRNHVFSELRKSLNKEPVDFTLSGTAEFTDKHPSPEKQLEFKEYQAILEKAIELLPEKRKMVFKLSRLENLSYSEIAERMEIKPSTVNDHITLALNFIKTYLQSHLPGTMISLMMTANLLGSAYESFNHSIEKLLFCRVFFTPFV